MWLNIGAAGHGITEGAIRAHSKKARWTRGTTQAITQPEPEAARLAALEARVEALALVVQEAGELLTDLAALNSSALWHRRPCALAALGALLHAGGDVDIC